MNYELFYKKTRDMYLIFNGEPKSFKEMMYLTNTEPEKEGNLSYMLNKMCSHGLLTKEKVKRQTIYTPTIKDFSFDEYLKIFNIDIEKINEKRNENALRGKGFGSNHLARVITPARIIQEHEKRGLKNPYVLQSQNRRDELKNKRAKISIGSSLA